MPEAGIHGIVALSKRSHIHRNQLYGWFNGDVIPSPEGFGKLATALGVGVGELYATYDGLTDAPRTPGEIEVHELTARVSALLARLERIGDAAVAEEISQVLSKKKAARDGQPSVSDDERVPS